MADSNAREAGVGSDAEGDKKLPMGIDEIDRKSQENAVGGLPRGSVMSVVSDPNSSGELLLDHLCYTARPTLYVTNTRNKEQIEENLKLGKESTAVLGDSDVDIDNVEILEIDNPEKTIDRAIEEYEKMDGSENPNVIIETMTYFETFVETDKYLSNVRELSKLVTDKGGLSYLFFISKSVNQLTNSEMEILNICDGILNVYAGGEAQRVEHFMEMNKIRKDDVLEEPLVLEVENGKFTTSSTTKHS